MGKEKIEDIMMMGHKSEYCTKALSFEVELAKLLTACTIMPVMNVGFDFEKEDNKLSVVFYPTGRSGHDIEECKIELDKSLLRTYQLCITANRIRTHMQIECILTEEDCLSKNDDVFWSALDDTAHRVKFVPSERESLINRVNNTSLKINTLRKMLNARYGTRMSEYESLLTTTLAFMDYYTNSNHPKNELSRLSVNPKTYFQQLDNFDLINRAIRDNCMSKRDVELNDYLAARDKMEDRKASYLAGLYQADFANNSTYNTERIIVSRANFLDDITEEMED